MATAFVDLAYVLLVGLPVAALGTLSDGQKQACVDWANADAGSRLAGRYPGINAGGAGWTWDESVQGYTAIIAKKRMLDLRGRNPSTANADKAIDEAYKEALEWFNDVQTQAKHPYITGSEAAGNTSQGPVILSTSTAWTNSAETCQNRGI